MIIYGEYLFLENFITGLILLFFTGRISGEHIRSFRLIAAGCLCGIYAFSLFAAVPSVISLPGRIVFSVAVSWIAFGKPRWKRLFFNAGIFTIVTFLYGGITIAVLGAFILQGAIGAEGIYLPAATYFTVTAAAAAAALVMWLAADMIKTRRRQQRTKVGVTVQMGGKRFCLTGFVDSGNFLKEPFTGKPVAVVRQSVMRQILKNCGDKTVRYVAIPYSSVGTERGIMDGYRIDCLTAEEKIIRKPVLAVCRDEELLTGKDDEGQILLPESMLERGIYADFEDNQEVFAEVCRRLRKGDILHRGKRCASPASGQRGRKEDAGSLCKRESGSTGSTH